MPTKKSFVIYSRINPVDRDHIKYKDHELWDHESSSSAGIVAWTLRDGGTERHSKHGSIWAMKSQGPWWATKKTRPLVGCLIQGMKFPIQLYRDYFISHYKDPYQPTRIQWNVNRVFFIALVGFLGKMSGMKYYLPKRITWTNCWSMLPIGSMYAIFALHLLSKISTKM